jgi:hypothetical protein
MCHLCRECWEGNSLYVLARAGYTSLQPGSKIVCVRFAQKRPMPCLHFISVFIIRLSFLFVSSFSSPSSTCSRSRLAIWYGGHVARTDATVRTLWRVWQYLLRSVWMSYYCLLQKGTRSVTRMCAGGLVLSVPQSRRGTLECTVGPYCP